MATDLDKKIEKYLCLKEEVLSKSLQEQMGEYSRDEIFLKRNSPTPAGFITLEKVLLWHSGRIRTIGLLKAKWEGTKPVIEYLPLSEEQVKLMEMEEGMTATLKKTKKKPKEEE